MPESSGSHWGEVLAPFYRLLKKLTINTDVSGRLLSSNRPNVAGTQVVVKQGSAPVVVLESDRGEPKSSEVMTVTLGVNFQLQQTSFALGTFGIPLQGVVEWGGGNAVYKANIDYNQGTKFTVAGNYVRISCQSISSLAVPDALVSASIAYGNTTQGGGSSSAVRNTVHVGNLAPGGISLAIPTPPFARSFNVFTGTPGAPIGISQIAFSTANQIVTSSDQEFPLQNGVTAITANNLSAAAQDISIQFNLNL